MGRGWLGWVKVSLVEGAGESQRVGTDLSLGILCLGTPAPEWSTVNKEQSREEPVQWSKVWWAGMEQLRLCLSQGKHKGNASQFFEGLAKYLACVLILMHAGVSKSWNTL